MISGSVVSASDGRPLDRVTIIVAGRVRGTTEADGRFSTTQITPTEGQVRLIWRRIGFLPADTVLAIGLQDSTVSVNLMLTPLPVLLDEIVVEGSRILITNPGMVGFYNRRADSLGTYLTEVEVQRRRADLRPHLVRLVRASGGPLCAPFERTVVFLDGMPFFDLQTLVRVITPNEVAGIEVYNKGEFPALPEEFILPVTTCRVVMVWTREIDGATSDVYQGYALGASLGPTLVASSAEVFVRGHVVVPVSILQSRLDIRLGIETAASSEISWRSTAAVALKLHQSPKSIFLSGGIAFTKRDGRSSIDREPMVGIGYASNLGRFQPLFEVRFVGSVPHSVLGFSFRFGSREAVNDPP